MATRIKDWMIPYTWWQWIEITNNHVINVLLREMNNLIHVNGDRELYVDLQLDDWIAPDDDFPVGVTTGKILQEDWWQQSWIILNWKTTSWDYVRLIYANDGKLYYDPWTWQWIELWWSGASVWVATSNTLGTIKLGDDTKQTVAPETPSSTANRTYAVQLNNNNQAVVNVPRTDTTYSAWANITIDQNNEISATIPQALVYKWTVNDLSDLPASWTVWDTYFVEWEDWMYSWDWTQRAYVWWTWIDTSNFFDKTIDTSDDIVQGTTNLFVTQQEKDTWNNKQDRLIAWEWINITNNLISNTLPFNPWNAGSLGQYLKKTNDWYAWANVPSWWETYTAGEWIDITNNVISNDAPFEPTNQWNIGQVLKKSGANSYYWANESWSSEDINVKLFHLDSRSDTETAQEVLDWTLAWKMPIIKLNNGVEDVYYCLSHNSVWLSSGILEFDVYMWPWQWTAWQYTYQVHERVNITYTWTTVSGITWNREELNKQWQWTQSDFDQLGSYENWVIYNILPDD
jgi:hypothetical protein